MMCCIWNIPPNALVKWSAFDCLAGDLCWLGSLEGPPRIHVTKSFPPTPQTDTQTDRHTGLCGIFRNFVKRGSCRFYCKEPNFLAGNGTVLAVQQQEQLHVGLQQKKWQWCRSHGVDGCCSFVCGLWWGCAALVCVCVCFSPGCACTEWKYMGGKGCQKEFVDQSRWCCG